MAYARLSSVIEDAVEALVNVGVSREVAESSMRGAEFECMADLIQVSKDARLLDLFARYETADIAKRFNVSPRTIRDHRAGALNRQSRRRTASA